MSSEATGRGHLGLWAMVPGAGRALALGWWFPVREVLALKGITGIQNHINVGSDYVAVTVDWSSSPSVGVSTRGKQFPEASRRAGRVGAQ